MQYWEVWENEMQTVRSLLKKLNNLTSEQEMKLRDGTADLLAGRSCFYMKTLCVSVTCENISLR